MGRVSVSSQLHRVQGLRQSRPASFLKQSVQVSSPRMKVLRRTFRLLNQAGISHPTCHSQEFRPMRLRQLLPPRHMNLKIQTSS